MSPVLVRSGSWHLPLLAVLSPNVRGQTQPRIRYYKNAKHFISMPYDGGQDAGTGKSSRDKRELGQGSLFVSAIGRSAYVSRRTVGSAQSVPGQLRGFYPLTDCNQLLINNLHRALWSPESLLHQWLPNEVAKTVAACRKMTTNRVMVINWHFYYLICDN